jgi:hypothetical protein
MWVKKTTRRSLLLTNCGRLLLFLFWNAADRIAIPAAADGPAGAATVEVLSVSEAGVALSTAPIVAVRAFAAERTVFVVAVACGRKKKGFTGGFVSKQSAVYAITSNPFITHIISVK